MLALTLLAQLTVVAQSPETASVCMPIHLTAAVRVPGRTAPRLVPPTGPGFQLLRSSVVSRVEPDGAGGFTTIAEASADVATSMTGRVVVPPFVVLAGLARAASDPITVNVRPAVQPPPVVLVRAALRERPDGRPTDTVVVGEQVDFAVEVLLNEPARNRLRRSPTFFPPEMASVLAYDLPLPPGVPRQGRRCFERLSYRRALFPLFAGPVVIPPAMLTYTLPLSSSFFSREESFEARTDSVRFAAVEPPAAGRPPEFTGAVGTFGIATRLAAPSARVGDPVVLTVRLDGTGNVKLLPRPALVIPWAALAIAEERVVVDTTAERIRGSKEFDWIVTPRREGRDTIPAVEYPFFDPMRREYLVARASPLTLAVTAGALASADTLTRARLPIRVVLRPERPQPLPSRPAFWLALALAPLPAAMLRLMRRRRWLGRPLSAARRLATVAAAGTPVPARELRRLFLDALRERVPAVGREFAPLARVLRRAGVHDGTALEAEALLERLDGAAFSPAGVIDGRALREAADIADSVDREAMPTPGRGRARITALVLLVAGAATLGAVTPDVRRMFDEGLRAYEREQFAIAARRFAQTADRAPRAVDAWSNLGTAAWAANDSAVAARAWHRVLRIDPLDAESRERLLGVQALGLRSPAYVAPVSIDAVAWFVLALWVGGWAILTVPHARRPVSARPLAGGSIALAVVGALGVLELSARLDARDLAVLTNGRPLAAAPSADAPASAPATAGEAGRVGARDGGWVHLTLDDGRIGWVPRSAVLPIGP